MGTGTQGSSKTTNETKPDSSSGKVSEQSVAAVRNASEQADRPAVASSSDEDAVTGSLDVDHSLSTS